MRKTLALILASLIGFTAGWLITVHTAITLTEPETKHILIVDWAGFVWEYEP